LQEVGEFEGADITSLGADFPLEVGDEGAQFVQGVTGPEEFEPEALALVAQGEGLTGELAVELMGLLNGGGIR
jgi:hypothetical protein